MISTTACDEQSMMGVMMRADKRVWRAFIATTGIAMSCLAASAALAQSTDSFYKGKSVDFIVGYAAGDTYDIYSRLAARHMPKYLPGNPTLIVRNMQGVASLKAANYMYAQAAQDGSSIGMVGQGVGLDQVVGNTAVQFDARKFNWIGRMVPVIQFIVAWHTVPAKTLEDVMKQEVVVGATSPSGATGTVPRLLNRLAGTKFKIIHGYPGVSGLMLAMERGETQAATASAQMLLFSKPELLAKPLVSVLVQYSKERSHLFPDVPALGEFGRTDDEKHILQLYGATTELGRALLAPPNVPADRIKTLRTAFDSMMKDAEFLAEAQKATLEVDALDGEGVSKIIHETIDVTPEFAKKVEAALAE
jgi:tripartite-type tricarboxylate transporter receptor subunit TctC